MKHFLLLTLTLVSISAGKLFATPGVTASSTGTITLPVNTAAISGAISGFKNVSGTTYSSISYTWTVSPSIGSMTSTTGSLSQDANGNATVAGPVVVFAPTVNTTYTFTLKIKYKKNNSSQTASATTTVVVNVPLVAISEVNQTLTLSGCATTNNANITASDSGGSGTYTYSWTKESGPAGGNTNTNSAKVNITGLQVGVYQYQVTVNGSAIDIVTVTVLAAPAELVFQNPTLSSGSAGQDNAVYKFSNVTNQATSQVDALVTITGRSSSAVTLGKDANNKYIIDETGTGYDNAFQPRIDYTGSYNSNTDWYMEFQVAFVKAGTTTPINVNSFGLSGLDLDGNSTYHEYISLYGLSTYTLEQNTQITASGLTSPSGERFDGARNEFDGIDVTATADEITANYLNINTFKIRMGGKVTSGSGSDLGIDNGREYSLWFKSLNFTNPVQTALSVKLTSFTVTKDGNYSLLKWTTESELDNEYMDVQRSTDGINFTSVGTVQGNGTSDLAHNYQFSDPIGGLSGMVYYRLRDVDADGKGSYSKIIALRLDGAAMSTAFSVYPNPFVSNVKLNITSTKEAKATVVISNLAGQQVAAQAVLLQNGYNIVVLQGLKSLVPGLYIVEFTTEDGKFAQKIVKNQ